MNPAAAAPSHPIPFSLPASPIAFRCTRALSACRADPFPTWSGAC